MRKILLASTALVAMTSVSAMAADITISGGYDFKYQNDTKKEATDSGSFSSEADIDIKFANTTDSGLTTTFAVGLHETGLNASDAKKDKLDGGTTTDANSDGAAFDDLNASLSGDFGTIYFDVAGDDVAIGGFDEKADKAGEGTDSGMSSGYRGGIMGASGTTVGYKLPSLVDGLTVALSHAEGASEYFGYAIGYDLGMADVAYVKEASNTAENTYVGAGMSFGDISVGLEQVTYDSETDADDRKTEAMGVSYAMGDITLAYEIGSTDDENAGSELENHKQMAVTYAVDSGIKLTVTNSEVDAATNTNDKEQLEVQLTLSF